MILVATPGRLWDFMESDQIPKLSHLKFLVIDEADRIVELGHYKELDSIIDKIMLPSVITHDKEII
jgi:ATP-dependent RNA helicase DDX24/MAK5